VTNDPSVGGSYLGCEPMGLFWGMQSAPGGREGLRQVMKTGLLRALQDFLFYIKPKQVSPNAVVQSPNCPHAVNPVS